MISVKQIKKLADLSTKTQSSKKKIVITHDKSRKEYVLVGFTKIKLNDSWMDVITYTRWNKLYHRFSNDFKGFSYNKEQGK